MLMKRYAVITCSKCKRSRIIETIHKKTKCPHCGKIFEISKLKKLFETNSQEEARNVIGLINAKKDGMEDEFTASLLNKKL